MAKDTKFAQGRWTTKEKCAIAKALLICGKNWVAVSKIVETRSSVQCRTHYLKSLIGARTRVVQTSIQRSRDFEDLGLTGKEEIDTSIKLKFDVRTSYEEFSNNPCTQGEENRNCNKEEFTSYAQDLFEYLMF